MVVETALRAHIRDRDAEQIRDERRLAHVRLHAVENLHQPVARQPRRRDYNLMHGMCLQHLLDIVKTAQPRILLQQRLRQPGLDKRCEQIGDKIGEQQHAWSHSARADAPRGVAPCYPSTTVRPFCAAS